ncbi:MAG: dienelactone hydrolase family protein [Dehalococcoidia bacterium]|nr:dienelactone hydrolase family protein [Dehalococcoidia bacterium]
MDLNIHQRYLIEEFAEEYHERKLGRRDLVKRVLLVTGSVPTTAAALLALGCGSDAEDKATASATSAAATSTLVATPTGSPAATATGTPVTSGPGVPANDPAVVGGDVRFPGPASDLLGYLARPRDGGPSAGILIIHENRGLTEHFKDVSRRYAKEGFVALAIDLVSRDGGSKADTNQNTGFLGRSAPADLTADLVAGVQYLKTQPFVRPAALGVTGFCFGGGYTWETAIASLDVKAAVPYYGTAPLDRIGRIRAAVLAMYGEADARITSQAPEVERILRAAGTTIEVKIYPGAGHAFFNDTGANYNAAAAADAWPRTLAWFRKYLA